MNLHTQLKMKQPFRRRNEVSVMLSDAEAIVALGEVQAGNANI